MLGPPKTRDLDRPAVVSLETLVPADHYYRHLERTLDLAFVREVVKDCYAAGGRPAIDPVVFFGVQPKYVKNSATVVVSRPILLMNAGKPLSSRALFFWSSRR